MKILAVCGSLQAKSKNLTLLSVAASSVPAGVQLGPEFEPQVAALVRSLIEAAVAAGEGRH